MKSNQHYLSPNRILWRICFFAISWTTETIAIYNLIRPFRSKISNYKAYALAFLMQDRIIKIFIEIDLI